MEDILFVRWERVFFVLFISKRFNIKCFSKDFSSGLSSFTKKSSPYHLHFFPSAKSLFAFFVVPFLICLNLSALLRLRFSRRFYLPQSLGASLAKLCGKTWFFVTIYFIAFLGSFTPSKGSWGNVIPYFNNPLLALLHPFRLPSSDRFPQFNY